MAFVAILTLGACNPTDPPLFSKITSGKSNLIFTNKVIESDSMNLAYNYYFYNGAGVTICDFNNDGLDDVLLIGNHVQSNLYLNQGNFSFKDISKEAGLVNNYWASGATFVDINGDNLQDIFICTVGRDEPNLLYINTGIDPSGIPKFEEKAKEFGLGEKIISTQAAFLDFDHDNDLDLFIAVNSQLMNNRNETKTRNLEQNKDTRDRLYLNNGNGSFIDVSESAGIVNEGYSLGVAINDINNDGWPDIYVANDFISNDLIYINNQKGGFDEKGVEYLRHASQNGMGVDIADINQDGYMDITVVDMLPRSNRRRKLMMSPVNYDLYEYRKSLGYIPQHVRNTLQINTGEDHNGNLHFNEIGCLAGIYSTDWSWAPLWADFDNSGTLDLFITNGYYKDLTDLDFSLGLEEKMKFGSADYSLNMQLEGLANLRPIKENNFYFKNNGDLVLQDVSNSSGIDDPSFSHGSAFSDLDNDGDLDLIINNLGQETFLYKNNTVEAIKDGEYANYIKINLQGPDKNTNAIGTRIKVVTENKYQNYYHSNVRGYLSSMGETIHFGLGNIQQIDTIYIYWPDNTYEVHTNIEINQQIDFEYRASNPKKIEYAQNKRLFHFMNDSLNIKYHHIENKYIDFKDDPLLLKMYSKEGPGITVGDINGDGKDDLILGGSSGQPTTLFTQREGSFHASTIMPQDAKYEDLGLMLVDVDNDGDQDLYVVSGGVENEGEQYYKDRMYINSDNTFIRSPLPNGTGSSGGTIRGADYDRDGDIDLFVTGKKARSQYPFVANNVLLANENGSFEDRTPEFLKDVGPITDALWSDFNGDGWLDLIAVGEWTEILFFINNKGQLEPYRDTGLPTSNGWWNSITSGDFDNDKDIDYVIGNFGINSFITASANQPVRLYVGDFDENGKLDPILSYYSENDNGELKEFPVHTRDALIDQIVGYKRRFKDYKSFADAEFSDILKNHDQVNTQTVLEASNLKSCYVENLGDGKFSITPLPEECQVSPIYGMLAKDFNRDGNLDVLLTGNQNSAEPLFGNHDALNGVVMIGNGSNHLSPIPSQKSGIYLNGDQKSIANLFVDDHDVIVAGANSGEIRTYGFNKQLLSNQKQEVIPILPLDVYAEIRFIDGRATKREFQYGHTYLSQSSRKFILLENMEEVIIHNSIGESRKVR